MRSDHRPGTHVAVILSAVLASCTALILSGCGGEIPTKPLDIGMGDTCVFCKQPITEKKFAAEFVTKDGFVRKFDDIACMVQHANKVKKANIAAYYAMDYPTSQWIKAEDAFYVKSKFKTPGNGGIIAYRDKAKAEGIAQQYQAQLIGFGDVLNAPTK